MTADRDTQAADDLDAAADVITEHGWCQGSLIEPDGRMCAEGAILRAVLGDEAAYGARFMRQVVLETAVSKLGEVWPEAYYRHASRIWAAASALRHHLEASHVYRWNDEPGMTQDQVTDAFRHAAKGIRERLGQTGA